MCVCILLALMFFLTLIYKLTPQTDNLPLITKYLIFNFIMHVIAIMETVIVLNWNFRTPQTHRMPKWVRVVFLNFLPRILLMPRPSPDEQEREKLIRSKKRKVDIRTTVEKEVYRNNKDASRIQQPTSNTSANGFNTSTESDNSKSSVHAGRVTEPHVGGPSHKMKRAIEAIRFIAAHLKNEEDYEEVRRIH